MATHSSVLAWRVPGTGEPSGLPSMGSRRVGHYWSDLALALTFYTVRLIMFPSWLAIKIIFYFLSGYWSWNLINIFYSVPTQGSNPVSCIVDRGFTIWAIREACFCNYYPLNTTVSWLVNRKIIKFYITKTTIE